MKTRTMQVLSAMASGVFAITVACCAQADMIYLSSRQAIAGDGTQLAYQETVSEQLGTFSEDLLNTGYVRDENRQIVGNVSAFSSLMSSLSDTHIRGLGRGSGFGTGDSLGLGTTSMKVEFMTEHPMRFAMSGQLRLAPHTLGLNDSEAWVRLLGEGKTIFEIRLDEQNPPDEMGNINFLGEEQIRGELAAGTYTLEAYGMGHGSQGLTRCVDFDFTFSRVEGAAVPEPAGLGLLLLALLAGSAARRRRR